MGDVVERLRSYRSYNPNTDRDDHPICDEAADRIEALEAERDGLRATLYGIMGNNIDAGTWHDLVKPLVSRFETAAKFKGEAVHNAEGSQAISSLMQSMAERLDRSVRLARAALKGGDA